MTKKLGPRVGNRNTWLHGKANHYLYNNAIATKEELHGVLLHHNSRLEKPLPDEEVEQIFREAWSNQP